MSNSGQYNESMKRVGDRVRIAKALARTYGGERDPWERVQEYQEVLEYTGSHPNKGSCAVANALDLPRSRIRSWVDGDGRPDPVRGIETAESRGWLDLSLQSDLFAGLNVLVAWIYSGGSIDIESFSPSFVVNNQADRDRLLAATQRVGVEVDVIRDGVKERATEMRPTNDGVVLGRLLHILGAPIGVKNADRPFSLPRYLDDAPHYIQLDFARTYVLNRKTPLDERPNTPIQLAEQRSRDFRREVIAFFGAVVGDPTEIRGGDGNQFRLTQRAASVLCEDPTFGEWA